MKVFVFLFVATLAFVSAEEKYTDKYDGVNVDDVLSSQRLKNNYADCLLDLKPCPTDGAELKRVIPDALSNDCAKCNPKQRAAAEKVIGHLYKHNKDIFEALEAKFDKEGTYRKKYADKLAAL